MRLSKFLSLAVAMSRNQAKFFIRKGRLSVNGTVVTDPEFEVAATHQVVFDGKPISVIDHQYIVLHKPAAYECSTKDSENSSVLELLKNRSPDHYFYFANVLAPEVSGLVLLSDDARWTNRIKKRLLKKPRVYDIKVEQPVNTTQIEGIKAESDQILELELQDPMTLQLKTENIGMKQIDELFAAADLSIESAHLKQLGRLSLGDLGEGEYLELAEDQIKI